uniref:FHA domain-containing protein n=1 Tax=Ditylenchus dipsaci TaxID=166011 RepID=A0A915DTC8_9BILA
MSTEGKMYCGHTPESDLPLGMVTRVDKEKEFIYVWGLSMGTSEIRFPLASKPDIEPGTLVNYHLGQDRRGVQYQKDIYVNRSHRLIIRRFDEGYVRKHGISYSVKTTIIFPPPTYEPYIKVLEKVNDHTGCYGVGFSPEYGQVGCFASRLKFKPGVVYDTYVCRMPSNTPPDLVAALGSFFIASAKDGLVPNPNKQEEVSAQAPWNHIKNLGASGVSGQPSNVCYEEDQQEEYEEEDDVREYESNRYQRQAVMSRSSSRAGPVSKRGSERGHIYPTRTTESVADKGSNLPIYQGIVVRLEEDYFIIWSHDHGTVCALHRRNNEFVTPLATWVNYCCHKDIIPLEEEDRGITQSAFRVKEIEPMRLSCALESTVQVQAKVWMSEDKTSVLNDSLYWLRLILDELLGPILCPRDNFLLRILKAGTPLIFMLSSSKNS